jgi:hypothetical protein
MNPPTNPPADTTTTTTATTTEINTQREGRLMLAAGVTLAGLTFVTALACRFITKQLFPYEITNLLYFTAAVFTVCGLYERADRRRRAGLRYAIEAQQENVRVLQHVGMLLGQIAEHLPIEYDKRYWKGYGAAARDGLADTGTDGPTRHLSAVAPVSPGPRSRN